MKIIDNQSCEIVVDNKISVSEIINEFNKNKINVVEILSKKEINLKNYLLSLRRNERSLLYTTNNYI